MPIEESHRIQRFPGSLSYWNPFLDLNVYGIAQAGWQLYIKPIIVAHNRVREVSFIKVTRRVVAVVDDEPDILELVSINLKKAGFDVREYHDSATFLDSIESEIPDLVVLDLMLPDIHGTEVCRILKSSGATAMLPIIMLTALIDETDRVAGLEMGADDYVTKPFSPRELVARVKAVLRRSTVEKPEKNTVRIGDYLVIDADKYAVSLSGKRIDLTSTEFNLLLTLARGKGRVFSRSRLLEILWQGEKYVTERTIDVHITHLRSKLGPVSDLIENVRGVGYRIRELS